MLCGALCCQRCQPEVFAAFVSVVLFQEIQELRKSGCDPNADLILYALNALTKHFRDDHGKVVSQTFIVTAFVETCLLYTSLQRIVARFRVHQVNERIAVFHDKRMAVLFAILFVKR